MFTWAHRCHWTSAWLPLWLSRTPASRSGHSSVCRATRVGPAPQAASPAERRRQAGAGGICVCLGYAAEPVCRGKVTVPPLPALRAELLSPQWPEEALVCGGEMVTVDLSMCMARAPASLRTLSGSRDRLLISLAGPASSRGERIMTALCPQPAPRDTGCGRRDLLGRAPSAGCPGRFAGQGTCACMHTRAHACVCICVCACVCACGQCAVPVQCLHIVGTQFKGAVGITGSHFLNKNHPSAWKTEGEEGPLPVAQGPGPQLVGVAGQALLFPQGRSPGEFRGCLPRLHGSGFPFPSELRPPQMSGSFLSR